MTSLGQGRSVYGFETLVGSGASAVVYRATHRQTGDFVAIKRYKEKSSAMSWREARIFCTLNHRHIVTFHQFNVTDVGAELIMEYAVLGSLIDQIKNNRLTVRDACTTIKHTLLALQYLHGRGITHRDIKPGNILIMVRNPIHAKVADFGLSSKADYLNTFCGTKRYLAPEIHRPPYTAKVDIWSVGVMVMDLWGVLPTRSDDSWAEKIVARARQVSNITTELLDACLQLDPNNRATAEQCLQLPFFHTGSDGSQEAAPFVSHLDEDGCATVVRREPLHLPDQQRQEPLAPDYGFQPEAFDVSRLLENNREINAPGDIAAFAAWKGDGCVTAVRLDSSIPGTATCNMQEGEPLDLPAQREEHLSAASKLVLNGEALEPFLPHGEGWQIPPNQQWEGWSGGRPFPEGETQINVFTNVPLDDIPTWNPINVEEWVPGGVNNYQLNAEAIGPGATLDNERLDVRGTTYHFFDWRETKIAHIPDQAMVNVTHIVATAGLRFCQLRSAQFLDMTRDKKHVVQGQPRIRGTYMLYSNAIDVCVWLKIDRSGLPSFLLRST